MTNSDLASKLKDDTLLVNKALVGGRWVGAREGSVFAVTDPATGEHILPVPDMGELELREAIDAAHEAQKKWAKLTGKERASYLRKLYDLVVQNVEDLAIILTPEMGKPLQEARTEILYGASYIEWFAEEAKRIYGDVIPGHQADKRIFVLKSPVGVVGAITPWNFPSAMLARKLAPALAVGCSVVAKPAAADTIVGARPWGTCGEGRYPGGRAEHRHIHQRSNGWFGALRKRQSSKDLVYRLDECRTDPDEARCGPDQEAQP